MGILTILYNILEQSEIAHTSYVSFFPIAQVGKTVVPFTLIPPHCEKILSMSQKLLKLRWDFSMIRSKACRSISMMYKLKCPFTQPSLPEHKNRRRKMNKTSNQKGLSLVRFVLTVSIYGIITQLVGVQTIWAQGVPPVLLRVLNEQNSSGQIVVIRGEPVEVEFLTSPGFATTDDMIQLVREDNGQVVSTVLTGGVELGSVLLSTEPENSLGELEVMYARSAAVILTAEQTVFVIPSVPPEPPTFVEVPPGLRLPRSKRQWIWSRTGEPLRLVLESFVNRS